MRYLAVASVAAFASLYASAHMVANVANARESNCAACHDGGTVLREMAQRPKAKTPTPVPTGWYIKAVQKIAGETSETRYTQHSESGVFVAIFESKQQCEDARVKDPNIAGTLAAYTAGIKARNGSVVISCAPWVHPVTPDEPAVVPTVPTPKGVDI